MSFFLLNFARSAAFDNARPLCEQAVELLRTRLWGIGPNAPFRAVLAPGDEVVVYVGAPDRMLVGSGVLATAVREWTPEEAARYPGGFSGGIEFGRISVWSPAIPIHSLRSSLRLTQTNREPRFLAGVVRLDEADFRTIIAATALRAPSREPD